MKDKEVGKLWRQCDEPGWVHDLIRNLVKERTAHYIDNPDFHSRHDSEIFKIAHAQALRDYDIDPETWK